MLAMNYRGPQRVRIDQKPMPEILHPEDAIVRVTRSCICGSDLHLYNGSVPDTRVGMTFGHEITGVVEQIGPAVQKLNVGDHVLVPFNIACGKCVFCQQELYGNCHESNPEATAVGGIFGYSHTAGGYDGGQAEYVRVPYADVGPTVIPAGMDPDDAVMLTDMENTPIDPSQIKGWGVDADPKNDPTYPMKHRNNGEHAGYSWERPPQQSSDVEVLHSNERPNVSAVFGTSTPPSGLSGALRRFAFQYSESSYGHWLPLMLADRVGVVEGIVADLGQGHLPNIFAELGGKAVWKHNRKGLLTGVLLGAALVSVLVYLRGGGDDS